MANGRTEERRLRQSAAIKVWAPWNRSTGPRTAAGKARRNADRGGHRRRMRELASMVRELIKDAEEHRLAVELDHQQPASKP
jgi:hypothetical protein